MSTNPYSSPTAVPTPVSATAALQPPAILLLISSLLGIVFMTIGGGFWVQFLFHPDPALPERQLAMQVVPFAAANLLVCMLVLAGAITMLMQGPRWVALMGAWAAVIPCLGPCYVLALPFGIWALLVLRKPEVIAAFQKTAPRTPIRMPH